jgi:hypothetical protein
VVVSIEFKRLDCCSVVDAYEDRGTWNGGGKEGGCGFLDSMEFRIVNLYVSAKVAASFLDSKESLVANVEDHPSTSSHPIVQL